MDSQSSPAALDDAQVEQWRHAYDEEQANDQITTSYHQLDAKREAVRPHILSLLHKYLNHEIDTVQFRATFDAMSRKEWDFFGMKGLNGAMFLNQLVKYVPDQEAVTSHLHAALPAPDSEVNALAQMGRFVEFIRGLLKSHALTGQQLQAARAPFFVSMWWHLQAPEQWPAFYLSGRQALEKSGLYAPTQDPLADYFAFRSAFLALASALGHTSWQLEHLLEWHERPHTQPSAPGSPSITPPAETHTVTETGTGKEEIDVAKQDSAHTHTQLLLARIGKKLGCNIWIAANDQGRPCEGGKLGDLSLKALPNLVGVDPNTQKIISLIDVLWLRGLHHIAAAFEIEHTTSIYSGLLRLSDLVATASMLNIPLYIVAPQERLEQVRRELSRPTFQTLELHKRCGYFSEQDLEANAEQIMKWATSPLAIAQIANYVGDVTGDEDIQQ